MGIGPLVRQEDPDVGRILWHDIKLQALERYPSLMLGEMRALPGPLYLCHNGDIYSGLTFEETLLFFGFHSSPEDIEPRTVAGMTTRSYFPETRGWKECFVEIEDITPPLRYRGIAPLIEGFFPLEKGVLRTKIGQSSRGFRIDDQGPLNDYYAHILKGGIPLFIDNATEDLQGIDSSPEKNFFVVNSLGIE